MSALKPTSTLHNSGRVLTATSTTSAPIRFSPSRPLRIVRSSRVDHPPVSGVPVAGATTAFSLLAHFLTLLLSLPRSALTSRIQSVNVQTQVHWVRGSDSVPDLLDDPIDANGIDLTRLHDLKAAVAVILIIRRSTQRRADAGVDVGVVLQQALLCGVVEVRSVIDTGDLGRGATEDFGAP